MRLPCTQLFRPPHGTPFIHNTADVYRVASVVRKHAVMILWTFAGNPTLDWDCDTSVQCVINNYLTWFQSGTSGIPLMHAVKAGTAGDHLPWKSPHWMTHLAGPPKVTTVTMHHVRTLSDIQWRCVHACSMEACAERVCGHSLDRC